MFPLSAQGTTEASGGVWEQKRETGKVKIYNHSSPVGTQQVGESLAVRHLGPSTTQAAGFHRRLATPGPHPYE